MATRIAVVGSINLDVVVEVECFPQPGETVLANRSREFPGGKGANQAVAAARLGAEVSLIGRLGDDDAGRRLTAGLIHDQVNTEHVQVTRGCATGLAVVMVDPVGQNSITVVPGANATLSSEDVENASEVISDASFLLIQLEVPIETAIKAIEVAKAVSTPVIMDPAPAPPSLPQSLLQQLLQVDVICPNESEATVLSGHTEHCKNDIPKIARSLQEIGARNVVVTLGSRGAYLLHEFGDGHCVQPYAIEPLDSTAAGDAFAAGLGVALAEDRSLSEAVQFASAGGAIAASRFGAQTGMPTRSEIDVMLSKYS